MYSITKALPGPTRDPSGETRDPPRETSKQALRAFMVQLQRVRSGSSQANPLVSFKGPVVSLDGD